MSEATLSDTLATLASIPARGSGVVRVVDFDVALPVEVVWRRQHGVDEFVVSAPQWRWRTVFDRDPGRLRVRFEGGSL